VSSLTATGSLLRMAARRDRIMIPVWIYALAGSVLSTAYSIQHLYPNDDARNKLAFGIAMNPAVLAITGKVYDTSLGGLVAWRMLAIGAALVGVMSVLLVVRHTRADEQLARLELLRSGVVGRQAPLAAAFLIAAQANLAVAVVAILGLVIMGLPVGGAVAFGLAWLAVGLCFAGVAGVSVQLAQTSRAANGGALAAVGGAFVLRAVADASGNGGASWLSWATPIGWAQHVQPSAGDRWAVLLLPFGAAVALVALAFRLQSQRDLGAGVLPSRPGPPAAAASLRSPLALSWRLHRGGLVAWVLGGLVLGALYGGAAHGVGDLVGGETGSGPLILRLGGSSELVDAFLHIVMGLGGLLAAAYGISAVLELRSEEQAARHETLLAGPTGRLRWAASHVAVALAGSALLLLAVGVATAIPFGLSDHDVPGALVRLVPAALVQLPAVWLVIAVAVLLYGVSVHAATAAWGVLAVVLFLDDVAPILNPPQWVLHLSPFAHLPSLPGGDVSAGPLVTLTALTALVLGAGFAALRRRDLG
jgi:ABC-2 type transport system permease protein